MKQLFSTIIILSVVLHLDAQWQWTQGPQGGFVSCYANIGEEIYVGTQYGGVFRSTDNGSNWSKRSQGLQSYDINCIFMDGDRVYAGTRLGGTGGVGYSDDDGLTWQTFPNLWTSYESSCIAARGDSIYIGTAGGGNVYSHNGGQSWSYSNSGILPYQSYSTSQMLVYGQKVLTIVNGRLYHSLDGAMTYVQLNNGLPSNTYFYQVCPLGDMLFASTSAGLFVSNNQGEFWQETGAGLPDFPYGMGMTAADDFIYLVGAIDGEIYFSNNNGFSWSILDTDWNTGLTSIYALANGELLIQSGYYSIDWATFETPQMHYTSDNGATWSSVGNGITSTWCLDIASKDGDLYVGTQFTGMYKSSDQGNSWQLSATPDYWESVTKIASFENTILASGDGGLLRSIDDGNTWTLCNQGLPALGIGNFTRLGSDIFASNSMGVLLSTDDGQTWSISNNGIADTYIRDIATLNETLYAISQSGLYQSVNFGNSWEIIPNDLPADFVPLEIVTLNDALIVLGNNPGGIYKSINGGTQWTYMGAEEIGVPTSMAATNDVILVGRFGTVTSSSVFMTLDGGQTWTDVSEGIDNNQVFDVIISDGWAYACVKGSGVYKRQVSELITNAVTEGKAVQLEVFPNPTADLITLRVSSQLIGEELRIVDTNGRLVHKERFQGSGSMQVNCSGFAAGVYFIQIGQECLELVKQ